MSNHTSKKKPLRIVFAGAGGSSAKTTGLVNLATGLAARGLRVRVCDLDNQGDASQYLGYTHAPYVTADVLGREKVYPDGNGGLRVPTLAEIEQPFYRPTLDEAEQLGGRTSPRQETRDWMQRITVIPSGTSTTGLTLSAAMALLERERMGGERVRHALETIDEGRGDDQVPDIELLDLYGVVGLFTYQAMAIADKVITAVTADDKTTGRHLDELVDVVTEVAGFNRGLQLDAIIPSRCPSRRDGVFYQTILEDLEADDRYGRLCTPRVRAAVTVPESFKAGEPLRLYVPAAPVTNDYAVVLEWLDEHGVTA